MGTRDHEEMQAKIQALAHLAGGIAHYFNNILQGILGLTQVALAKKTLPNLKPLATGIFCN
jgi:signal transduction histidine kinase